MLGADQVVIVGYISHETGEIVCHRCASVAREARTLNVDTPQWEQVIRYTASEAASEGAYAADDESDDIDGKGYGYVCDTCGIGLEEL